ncbi:MAG: NAD(P)H-binding protein [Polyangiaceae bacterium]|nr:NAD(P)H-binding protein [Myxococcales bacterium]MCB9587342.1 NAD(P)H-binding protein [Polyangiaceae bacterium]MCB9605862.1 NAD(P)H-binding protein [Polyangiaceae bacterium]
MAIAGASGFVGRHLIDRLKRDEHVIALSRGARAEDDVEWREADLFSATSTLQALQGCDVAIYLVHSMMPSSRLFQGSFRDTDLLLADNFAKAAVKNGVRHLIYLGGLVPEGALSSHLSSRREVEDVFNATGIPLTVLRAGMIVGPGGSSFEILHSLVLRLPLMVLPAWTQSTTQAVFIDDVVEVLARALREPEFRDRTLDLVNGEHLTYEALLRQTAEVLSVRRRMLKVPIDSTGFSKLWVSLFSNSAYELVSPLIDSLRCDLPSPTPDPLIVRSIQYASYAEMARESLERSPRPVASRPKRRLKESHSVRSIQRLPVVSGHDARWITEQYARWLPGALRAGLRVDHDEARERLEFRFGWVPWPLLVLQRQAGPDAESRDKLHIVGGLLSHTNDTGWLEFRQVQDRRFTLAAIHEFVPALPWYVYRLTQAPIHSWVMGRFARFLEASNRAEVTAAA